MDPITILFIGDVVGRPGRRIVRRGVATLRRERAIDFIIANGENAAGGSGVTPDIAWELFAAGVNCLTTGDHAFKQRAGVPLFRTEPRLLRPANLSPRADGRGAAVYRTDAGVPVAVVNLQGQTYMRPIDSPFHAVEATLADIGDQARVIVVDMHAEATSEKIALGWLLDGRVSAVIGTHTHVPTADERVLPGGTAYITDVGLTGPFDSVLGRRTDRVLSAILTGMPQRFDVATGDNRLGGVLLTVDPESGHATAIERVCVREDDLPDESDKSDLSDPSDRSDLSDSRNQ